MRARSTKQSFVVMELLKNFAYSQTKSNLTYYRDSNAREIDIILEENGRINPPEVKMSANPDRREIKKYSLLDEAKLERGAGGILCMYEEVIPIDENNCFIPCNLI